MIIVDSNTWADYFNGTTTPCVRRLEDALESDEEIAVLPVIVTEVLQGFRTERGFEQAHRVLLALPVVQPGIAIHIEAARMFRSLRGKGVTVRGAIDCIIAATCIQVGAQLLSPDADFVAIARHTALQLWRPSP